MAHEPDHLIHRGVVKQDVEKMSFLSEAELSMLLRALDHYDEYLIFHDHLKYGEVYLFKTENPKVQLAMTDE